MTALETKADAEALINKEGIEYVSVRFTDLIGVQQHFTVPASEFLKDAFTDGMPFDGSSVEGFQAINESDMKLVPDVSTAFIVRCQCRSSTEPRWSPPRRRSAACCSRNAPCRR